MPIETSYSNLRQNLAKTLDRIVSDSEVVIVRRKTAGDVAMLPAADLEGLLETAYLLRSPANAVRLRTALRRAEVRGGKVSTPEKIRREMKLDASPKTRRRIPS